MIALLSLPPPPQKKRKRRENERRKPPHLVGFAGAGRIRRGPRAIGNDADARGQSGHQPRGAAAGFVQSHLGNRIKSRFDLKND